MFEQSTEEREKATKMEGEGKDNPRELWLSVPLLPTRPPTSNLTLTLSLSPSYALFSHHHFSNPFRFPGQRVEIKDLRSSDVSAIRHVRTKNILKLKGIPSTT